MKDEGVTRLKDSSTLLMGFTPLYVMFTYRDSVEDQSPFFLRKGPYHLV